jgi:hypothetical protein
MAEGEGFRTLALIHCAQLIDSLKDKTLKTANTPVWGTRRVQGTRLSFVVRGALRELTARSFYRAEVRSATLVVSAPAFNTLFFNGLA